MHTNELQIKKSSNQSFVFLQIIYKEKIMRGMVKTLFTEDEYREALKRFLEICDTEDNTPEADELEQLMTVMEIYEQENCS